MRFASFLVAGVGFLGCDRQEDPPPAVPAKDEAPRPRAASIPPGTPQRAPAREPGPLQGVLPAGAPGKQPIRPVRDHVVAAYSMPQTLVGIGEQTVSVCVSTVYAASILGGEGERLVTTGTVKGGREKSTYSPTPADHLRLVTVEGAAYEFHVTSFAGDLQRDPEGFLASDHEIEFRVTSDDGSDVRVVKKQRGKASGIRVTGTVHHEGTRYVCDIVLQVGGGADVYAEHEQAWKSSVQALDERSLRGKIEADELRIEVDESIRYKLVSFDQTVENHTAVRRTRWTSHEIPYVFQDLMIRKSFNKFKPDERDFWRAEGRVVADGEDVGRLQWDWGGGDKYPVRIWLEVGEEKIELEQWRH